MTGVRPRGAARYTHAFVVTYGRSGSTLLQGLLNAIPGYLIRGENYDFLRRFETVYKRLPRFGVKRGNETTSRPVTRQATHPFFGFENFTNAAYQEGIGLLVDHLLLRGADASSVRCVGFKEIRYTPENVADKVAFLRTIFPGCAIIYNVRNPDAVVQSAFQKGKEVEQFEHFNVLLEERSRSDAHAFLVRYEDVVRGSGSLIGLHEFLGEPFDAARVQAVLSVRHSHDKKAKPPGQSDAAGAVSVNERLGGFLVFVTDRVEVQGTSVKVGGLMVPRENQQPRRFNRVMDEQGKPVEFRVNVGLPSPRLGDKLKNEAARNARFLVSFTRDASGDHQIFFDDGELALTVRAEASPLS